LAAVFRLIREGEGAPAHALPEDLADAAALGLERGARRLMRRRLLRALAAEILDLHPDALRFHREASGLVKLIAPELLHVSVADRGAWTALAVAPHPVGVDIDLYPPDRDPPFDLLQPRERDIILADPDPARLFLRFWTAREAYLKADGRGLSVMPDRVRAAQHHAEAVLIALIEEGRPITIARIVERDDAVAAIVELAPGA